jgi:hypothetical protein
MLLIFKKPNKYRQNWPAGKVHLFDLMPHLIDKTH